MVNPISPLVLVIDDAAEIRELIGHLLRRAGFRVATAPDGFQASRWRPRYARRDSRNSTAWEWTA